MNFGSIVRLVVRRSLGNWRLLLNIAIGVIVAATLLSSTAIYSDAIRDLGLTYALQHHDRNKLDVQIHLGSLVTQRHDNDVRNTIIANSVQNTVGRFLRSTSQNGHSATFFLSDVGKPAPADDNRPRAFFQYFTDLQQHAHLVSGAWPSAQPAATPDKAPTVPVLISKQTADRLHLQIGQSFDLHPFWRPVDQAPVRVTISGLIEPNNLNEEYWLGATDRFDVTSTTWATYPFFTDEKTFVDTVAGYLPDMDSDYVTDLYIALDHVNGRNAQSLEFGLEGLSSFLGLHVERATVETDLPDVIRNFRTHLFFTRVPLFALIVQIVGIVLYYIVMVATMLVDRQAGEIALLKSRGAGTGQILGVYAIEGGLLGLVAFVLGPLLAAGAVKLLGPTPPFHSLSGGHLLAVHISLQAYLLALLGAALSFVALLLPAYRAARLSIVHYKQGVARPDEQPLFLKYYLDLFLIGVGALAFYELREQGSLITNKLFGSSSANPLLLAAPTLFMLMIALFFLRLFPLLLRAIAWAARRLSGAAVMLGLWHMVRSPVHYSRLILLLILATSIAVFAASFRATLDRSYDDRAAYQAGADLRLSGLRLSPFTSPAAAESLGMDATDATAAAATTRVSSSYSPAPYRSIDATMLAVDSPKFADIAYFRGDFASQSLKSLMKSLSANRPPQLPGIPLSGAAQIGVWLLNPGHATGFQLNVQAIDAAGRVWDYRLADTGAASNGWQFFAQSLQNPGLGGRFGIGRPVAPLRLQSLYVTTNPVQGPQSQQVTLYFDDLQTTPDVARNLAAAGFANATVIDGFEDVGNLEPVDGLSELPTSDTFSRSTAYTHGGRYSGELSWTQSQASPLVHGLRVRGDGQPLEMLASTDFLKATGTHVGQTIRIFVASTAIPAHIRASFSYFPTYERGGEEQFLVSDISRLTYATEQVPGSGTALEPSELWLKNPSQEGVAAASTNQRLSAEDVFHRAELRVTQQHDPLVEAGWEGILFLLLSGVLLLTALGFLVYSYLSAQARVLEFAVLRTMGFSSLQIAGDVVFEQCFVIVSGLLAGTLLGLPLSALMIGYMGIDENGATVIPPFVSSVSWTTVATVYALLALVFFCTIVALVVLYSRLAISRTLRMGEL